MPETNQGTCFCGAVAVEVTGAPEAMGYCHCASCRSWSAGPVNAFTLWKPEAVVVTRGADKLGHYAKTAASDRKFCTVCGGHVLTDDPDGRLRAGRARELRRERAADEGRPAEAQGLPRGARRLRRDDAGVDTAGIDDAGAGAAEAPRMTPRRSMARVLLRRTTAGPATARRSPTCPR